MMTEKFEDKGGNLIRCVTCNKDLVKTTVKRRSVEMHGQKCPKCGEIYFPSSEIAKYEMLTGKSIRRKFRESGNSIVITVPTQIVKKLNIHEDDIAIYEPEKDGFKVKVICEKK